MTCSLECTQFDLAMELLIENGFDGIAKTVGMLMNTAMKPERSRHLNAGLYERKTDRIGYANGYKAKTMRTRFGEIDNIRMIRRWRIVIDNIRENTIYHNPPLLSPPKGGEEEDKASSGSCYPPCSIPRLPAFLIFGDRTLFTMVPFLENFDLIPGGAV